jgi:Transposase
LLRSLFAQHTRVVEQLIALLAFTAVVEVCRKLGIIEQTFYRWKRKFAGMGWLSCDGCGRSKRRTADSNSWWPI